MDNHIARQLAFVMANLAEMHAVVADIEALKAELMAMEANDRSGDSRYTEEAYMTVAKKILDSATLIRVIAGQMGANAVAMG
jgi:hypothetical protein